MEKNVYNCRDSNPPYDQPVTGLRLRLYYSIGMKHIRNKGHMFNNKINNN